MLLQRGSSARDLGRHAQLDRVLSFPDVRFFATDSPDAKCFLRRSFVTEPFEEQANDICESVEKQVVVYFKGAHTDIRVRTHAGVCASAELLEEEEMRTRAPR